MAKTKTNTTKAKQNKQNMVIVALIVLLLLLLWWWGAMNRNWWPNNNDTADLTGTSQEELDGGGFLDDGDDTSTGDSSNNAADGSSGDDGSNGSDGSTGGGSSNGGSGGSSTASRSISIVARASGGNTKANVDAKADGLNRTCTVTANSAVSGKSEVCIYSTGSKIVTVTYRDGRVVSVSRSGF